MMDATENKIDKAIDIFSCEWSLMKVIGEDSPLFHQLNMVNLGFMSIPEDSADQNAAGEIFFIPKNGVTNNTSSPKTPNRISHLSGFISVPPVTP